MIFYGSVRNFVREARHQGLDIKLEEGSGWLSRPFWFSGPVKDVLTFRRALEAALPEEEDSNE